MPIYYANPNPIFQPAMRLIASITQSNPAVVATTFAHQYLDGTVVRLDVPQACGMTQVNQLTGTISVIDSTSFFIDIDTTQFAPFVIPTFQPHVDSAAECVPIGSANGTLAPAVQNVLPFNN
jgi:hypothetical protein